MKNDFDDEIGRENARNKRRSSYSQADTSNGNHKKPGYNRGEQTPGRTAPRGQYQGGERNRGTSRPQSSPGENKGTFRTQKPHAAEQRGQRSRTAPGGSGQRETHGQIVIGDGKTRQTPRRPDSYRQARGGTSRSAAQVRKKKKITRFIIMAVAEVLTLTLIFSYAYVARLMGAIPKPDIDPNKFRNTDMSKEQKEHMTGFRTIAIFGVDSREGNVNKGTNADVIILCNINRGTGEIRLVSVFRDTYLNINDGKLYNKINAAYANGGAARALSAINKNLDLDISEYVTFNWKSVADGINMLGGVDVDITKPEFRSINSFITETVKKTGVPSVQLKSAGLHHLDGVQAVAYARLRKMDTDFQRTKRQRLIIQKIFAKAKKSDLGLLNRVLMMELEQIGTNLTGTDFTELLLGITKYHIGETGGFPFTKGDMMMGKKGDCVIAQTLESNVSELHEFLFDKEDYEPSDTVKKISAKIAADSGMYKKQNRHEAEKTTKSDEPYETTKSIESTTEEESIEETDEFGFPIESTEESEQNTRENQESKSGPGDTSPEETSKKDSRPGETDSDRTSPGDFFPEETLPVPGETETEPSTDVWGPGNSQPTQSPETKPSDSTSEGPGQGTETTESQPSAATSAADNEIPVVSAPPGNN